MFIIFLIFSGAAQADRLPEFYRGARAMGMGNAFTAVSDDHDAIFYNPAGIAFNRTVSLQIGNAKLESSTDNLKIYKNFASGFTGDTLQKSFGNHITLGGSTFPSIWLPNFAIGYYYGGNVHTTPRNLAYPSLQTTYAIDKGIVTGFGFEHKGFGKFQYLRWGASLKALSRTGYEGTIPVTTLATGDKTYLKSLRKGPASGYGATLGLQYEINLSRTNSLVLGSAWQDIGDMTFGSTLAPTGVPIQRNNLSAGFSLEHMFSNPIKPRPNNFKFTMEARHLAQENIDTRLKLHAGTEIEIGFITLRAGLNQTSNWTAGVGANLWIFDVQAATYGVEDLSISGLDRERRYLIQFETGIDLFDVPGRNKRAEDRYKSPRALK